MKKNSAKSQRELYVDACETPIEEYFIYAYYPYRAQRVDIYPQSSLIVPYARFRLDFILSIGSKNIGIECDGRGYHNSTRDLIRDTLILGSGLVQGIMRFPGWALDHMLDDCIYALSRYYPELFSELGREVVMNLANPHVKELINPPDPIIHCDIRDSSVARFLSSDLADYDAEDRSRTSPFKATFHSFDQSNNGYSILYLFFIEILKQGFKTFDEICKAYPILVLTNHDLILTCREDMIKTNTGYNIEQMSQKYKNESHFLR